MVLLILILLLIILLILLLWVLPGTLPGERPHDFIPSQINTQHYYRNGGLYHGIHFTTFDIIVRDGNREWDPARVCCAVMEHGGTDIK